MLSNEGKHLAAYLNLDYAGSLYIENNYNIDSHDVYKACV